MTETTNRTFPWRVLTDTENAHAVRMLSDHLMVDARFDDRMTFLSFIQDRSVADLIERYTQNTDEDLPVAMELKIGISYLQPPDDPNDTMERFIADHCWSTVLDGLAEWFDASMVRGDELRLGMREEVDVSISSDLMTSMLENGYRDFLKDESIPQMKRAMMFLSALGSATDAIWVRKSMVIDPAGGKYLSASMARSIAAVVDFDALAVMDSNEFTTGGFGRGFCLFAPVSQGTYQVTTNSLWYLNRSGFDDHAYKLVSVLLARMAGQEVHREDDWVVPQLGDCHSEYDGNPSVNSWLSGFNGHVQVDDELLTRLSALDKDQARSFYRSVAIMVGGGTLPLDQASPKEAIRLTGMIFDLLLRLIEADFGGKGELIPAFFFRQSALPTVAVQPLVADWCEAEDKKLEPQIAMTGYHIIWPACLYSLTKLCTDVDRFAAVADFWLTANFEFEDFVRYHDLAEQYLSLPDGDDAAELPFDWWAKLVAYQED